MFGRLLAVAVAVYTISQTVVPFVVMLAGVIRECCRAMSV